MQIVRLFLTPDTLNPPNIRWSEECDCIQQTPDGGATWVDVPALDPRHADGFRLPPLTGEDARCDAAARMVAYLHRLVDIDLLAVANWTLASLLLETLLLVIPGGVLVDLILLIADVILTIGSTAINDAFTSGVYDDLRCTYYCHLDADGQLSESGLADLAADIEANYSSVVLAVWTVHNQTLWEVGWSNAGVAGTETGDCDECAPCGGWCYEFSFLGAVADGWTPANDCTLETGGWQNPGSGPYPYATQIQKTIDTGASVVTTITIAANRSALNDDGFDGVYFTGGDLIYGDEPLATGDIEIVCTLNQTMTGELNVQVSNAAVPSTNLIQKVTFRGTGENPFGADNCDL